MCDRPREGLDQATIGLGVHRDGEVVVARWDTSDGERSVGCELHEPGVDRLLVSRPLGRHVPGLAPPASGVEAQTSDAGSGDARIAADEVVDRIHAVEARRDGPGQVDPTRDGCPRAAEIDLGALVPER